MLVRSSLSFRHSCASAGVGAALAPLPGAPAEPSSLEQERGSYEDVPSCGDDLAFS